MSSSRTVAPVSFIRAILEILGVVTLRFRTAPRLWGIWLVAVNAAALVFLPRVEAIVTLVVVAAALGIQAVIYRQLGFVRSLGASHGLWVPMLVWFLTRLASIPAEDHAFRIWLIALVVTNFTSLVIDATDLVRFVRGDRLPYYAW